MRRITQVIVAVSSKQIVRYASRALCVAVIGCSLSGLSSSAQAEELTANAGANIDNRGVADLTSMQAGSAIATTNMALAAPARTGGMVMADKLVVLKSQRRLLLLRRGEVLRSYHVALGLRPQGHKEQEGDFKTPEGQYRLIRRNPRSDYFLSMEVSYPSPEDVQRAQRSGVRPGGAIMLHGWPNTPRKNSDYYKSTDWTDGCIAVANSDMVEIWLMTPIDTPIDILP